MKGKIKNINIKHINFNLKNIIPKMAEIVIPLSGSPLLLSHQGLNFKINPEISLPEELYSKLSFNSIYNFIKKKHQIRNSRKYNSDSLLKKVKGKFFKEINDCLQKCLLIKIHRLPQFFITNITIEYNKFFLDKTLFYIYKYFEIIPKNENVEELIKNGKCKRGSENLFRYLCYSNIVELYNKYVESNIYKREVEFIKKTEGKRASLLFQFVSENFALYYINCKSPAHSNRVIDVSITMGKNIESSNDNYNYCGNNGEESVNKSSEETNLNNEEVIEKDFQNKNKI